MKALKNIYELLSQEQGFIVDYAMNNKDQWRMICLIINLKHEVTSELIERQMKEINDPETFRRYLAERETYVKKDNTQFKEKKLNNLLKIYEFRFC
jgi:hypothetical protein